MVDRNFYVFDSSVLAVYRFQLKQSAAGNILDRFHNALHGKTEIRSTAERKERSEQSKNAPLKNII